MCKWHFSQPFKVWLAMCLYLSDAMELTRFWLIVFKPCLIPLLYFSTRWKHQKTSGCLTLLGDMPVIWNSWPILLVSVFLAGIYLLKVNNRNTKTRREICSKLALKTPEPHHWRRSGIFIVNLSIFETLLKCFYY